MAVYKPTYRDAKTKELKQAAVWEKIEPRASQYGIHLGMTKSGTSCMRSRLNSLGRTSTEGLAGVSACEP